MEEFRCANCGFKLNVYLVDLYEDFNKSEFTNGDYKRKKVQETIIEVSCPKCGKPKLYREDFELLASKDYNVHYYTPGSIVTYEDTKKGG